VNKICVKMIILLTGDFWGPKGRLKVIIGFGKERMKEESLKRSFDE
jgi:hypothetical protein